ncbi:MAG: hypothetical protein ACYC26_10975 [Phycisphaerales bacterium]
MMSDNQPLKLKKAVPQRLRTLGVDEKWLQEQLVLDPSLLGLGDLRVIQQQKIQPTGGRLDLLLSDPDTETRYEVEIMLGATDESHIIRTIEYWDIERQRYPLFEHRAVIVAEEITSRFFNVIRLLNRAIPLIAIQLSAFRADDGVVLQFIRVLDTYEFSNETEEEETPESPADRSYWEGKSNPDSLRVVDVLKTMLPSPETTRITYNRYGIALGTSGYQFAWCYPRSKAPHCTVEIKVLSEERQAMLESLQNAGVSAKPLGRKRISLRLMSDDLRKYAAVIRDVLRRAEEWSRR